MEYSVSLYSFYSAIQKGELTPLGCVEKAAELGFDAVEAVDFVNFSGTQEEKKAQALELKQAAEKCGLQFSSLAIGADFLNGSDGDQEKEIQRVKDYVDIAALLGAPRMRHDITAGYKGENYRSYESLIPTLAQAVREVADYAASKGVMTMTENHGFFSQDSDRVEKLYMAVDHPNFGLLCDLGNFLCADETPAEVLPLFEERLKNSGILPLLDRVFISEYLGANKPQLGFFDACFASLPGVKRSESLMLGDSLTSDMLGGKIAGMHTCWYNPNRLPLPTDGTVEYQIHRLPDLLPLLEKL